MTIVEFLLARIAEDEAWARARQREDFRRHRVSAHRSHLAPDDPTRVLADCEAKRTLVEEFADFEQLPAGERVDQRVTMRWACELAALPYADHPDYREEWRP